MMLQEVIVDSDSTNWMVLVPGLVMPLLVAVVEDPSYSKPVRAGISVGVTALVSGFITVFTNGDWRDFLLLFLGLFFISIVMLYGLWKPLGATDWLENLISRKVTRDDHDG